MPSDIYLCETSGIIIFKRYYGVITLSSFCNSLKMWLLPYFKIRNVKTLETACGLHNIASFVIYEVLTAVTVKVAVSWDTMLCSLVEVHQCFRVFCCLHYQIRRWRQQKPLKLQYVSPRM